MLLWLLIGWPCAAVLFGLVAGKTIARGMGSTDVTPAERQLVTDIFDGVKP